MKGNNQVIKALNELLSEELAAIRQYMVHAEMAANLGYWRCQYAQHPLGVWEIA